MIGLDTNVLARYYVDDQADSEAQRQRIVARNLIESGHPLMVVKSVILELEWVLRGYYAFNPDQTLQVLRHLLRMPHVTVEDRAAVEQAISGCSAGLDFADALHHASYRTCRSVASFDDKRLGGRAKRLALAPPVLVPN